MKPEQITLPQTSKEGEMKRDTETRKTSKKVLVHFVLLYVETGSCSITQAGLQLTQAGLEQTTCASVGFSLQDSTNLGLKKF